MWRVQEQVFEEILNLREDFFREHVLTRSDEESPL